MGCFLPFYLNGDSSGCENNSLKRWIESTPIKTKVKAANTLDLGIQIWKNSDPYFGRSRMRSNPGVNVESGFGSDFQNKVGSLSGSLYIQNLPFSIYWQSLWWSINISIILNITYRNKKKSKGSKLGWIRSRSPFE